MHRECRESFPRQQLQRKPPVNDPGMHHRTCVTHVPWCMSGSLTRGGGENVPGIPGTCATLNFTYLVRGAFGHVFVITWATIDFSFIGFCGIYLNVISQWVAKRLLSLKTIYPQLFAHLPGAKKLPNTGFTCIVIQCFPVIVGLVCVRLMCPPPPWLYTPLIHSLMDAK